MTPLAVQAQRRAVSVEQLRSERQAAREAQAAPRRADAAKRAEIRRLRRELFPPTPKVNPHVLTLDEQLESLRAAAAARKAGDARPSNDLVREAADRVREARKPRER